AERRAEGPEMVAELLQVDAEVQPLQHQAARSQPPLRVCVELGRIEHHSSRTLYGRRRIHRDDVVLPRGEPHIVATIRRDDARERAVQVPLGEWSRSEEHTSELQSRENL